MKSLFRASYPSDLVAGLEVVTEQGKDIWTPIYQEITCKCDNAKDGVGEFRDSKAVD